MAKSPVPRMTPGAIRRPVVPHVMGVGDEVETVLRAAHRLRHALLHLQRKRQL